MISRELRARCQPSDPNIFDNYEIEVIDEWRNDDDTVGHSALVTHHMTPEVSFVVESDGGDSPTQYGYFDEDSKELYERFSADARRAYPNNLFPADTAVLWLELRDHEVADDDSHR